MSAESFLSAPYAPTAPTAPYERRALQYCSRPCDSQHRLDLRCIRQGDDLANWLLAGRYIRQMSGTSVRKNVYMHVRTK